ncbi:MAG: ubiquinol-cytochrome c reductase iron-sulfur subunit [Deltaproteobacteria bacterium]|nr:ubiquinol-cytochrome c reductase iron-sulfur subunit [Deltaproteobacteria bacterium]
MSLGLGFGIGMLGLRFLQFLSPKVKADRFEEILVGSAGDVSASDVMPMEIGNSKVFLLKTDTGLIAFSRKCTDLGCLVSWDKAKEQFICPCHQGVYDRNGKNIAGPPPRPLDRFQVVQKGENIYVKVKTA